MSRKKTPRQAKQTRPAKQASPATANKASEPGEANEATEADEAGEASEAAEANAPPTSAAAFAEDGGGVRSVRGEQPVPRARTGGSIGEPSRRVHGPVVHRARLSDRPLATDDRGAVRGQSQIRVLPLGGVSARQTTRSEHVVHGHGASWRAKHWPRTIWTWTDYFDIDVEPGLGNGGLGRLAACFIDSLATLDIPAVGYGIRYEFGIFRQTFEDGWQVEKPDGWLLSGNPWEFVQSDDMVKVGFWGHTENLRRGKWQHADTLGPQSRSVGRTVHDPRARLPDRRRSTSCVSGAPGPRRSSISSCSTWVITRVRSMRRCSRRRSAKCCIPTTRIPTAGNSG